MPVARWFQIRDCQGEKLTSRRKALLGVFTALHDRFRSWKEFHAKPSLASLREAPLPWRELDRRLAPLLQ